jgi:hypothetical protein
MAEKTLLYLESSLNKSVNNLQQIYYANMSCAGFRWSVSEDKGFLSNTTWIIPAVFVLWPD